MKIATQRATINVKPDSPSIYVIGDNLGQVMEISKDNVELYMEKLPPKLVVNQSGFDENAFYTDLKNHFEFSLQASPYLWLYSVNTTLLLSLLRLVKMHHRKYF